MEVVVAMPPPPPPLPPSSMDFNFDSNCSSPYITAPSSPQRFGSNNFFFSAPTSPTRIPHSLFNPRHSSVSISSTPNNTDSLDVEYEEEDEFEFDFDTHLQRPSLSADELFIGGKIKPLSSLSTDKKDKKVIKESQLPSPSSSSSRKLDTERAKSFSIPSSREKSGSMNTNGSNRVAGCDDVASAQTQGGKNNSKTVETVSSSTYSSFLSSISFTKGYRKWRIKDFLLFRSASEGRASGKDPLRKYAVLSKTTAHEDVRNLSFRSVESSGSGSSSRRRGPISAHELHYTVNRAASVELKKKTLLPYKQGLLGCLGFNPGMHHFSTRIGNSERSSTL